MAVLSVSSATFALSNPTATDDLHGPCCSSAPRADFFSKVCSQLQSFKKAHHHRHHHHRLPFRAMVVSASVNREVYQPFRPPIAAPAENLSLEQQLEILKDRQGLWFNYAVHVPTLIRAGFTPATIEEATGMSGVEQNKIVVASQVRSSLQSSGMDEATLMNFDVGGADILYELRILSAEQRKSAAEYALERRMDPKDCRDLARAMKDYERRKREEAWNYFTFTPGDCMALTCYRLSKEVKSDAEREVILKKGLDYAVSEKARDKLQHTLETGAAVDEQKEDIVALQVVRLSLGESVPHVMPVVEPNVQELEAAPVASRSGPFTIHHSDTAWKSWISLPSWEPLVKSAAPVAISYPNASVLPWKPKSKKELEEPIIVVADKHQTDMSEDGYFMVEAKDGLLDLQRGMVVAETGSRLLGRVILAIRPPLPEIDEMESIEWD